MDCPISHYRSAAALGRALCSSAVNCACRPFQKAGVAANTVGRSAWQSVSGNRVSPTQPPSTACCNALRHVATEHRMLQRTATCCNGGQHVAPVPQCRKHRWPLAWQGAAHSAQCTSQRTDADCACLQRVSAHAAQLQAAAPSSRFASEPLNTPIRPPCAVRKPYPRIPPEPSPTREYPCAPRHLLASLKPPLHSLAADVCANYAAADHQSLSAQQPQRS